MPTKYVEVQGCATYYYVNAAAEESRYSFGRASREFLNINIRVLSTSRLVLYDTKKENFAVASGERV
jgi:hypothetical protein